MYTIADTGGAYFSWVYGLTAVIFVSVSIILIEMLVLRGLKWGSLRASFVDSVVINLISAIVGVFFAVLAFSLTSLNLGFAPLLLILGAFTVLIEGAILTLMKRHPLRQTWIAAVVINVVSYAFLYVVLVGVFRL
jgi:VIT1/CCC1 family predicted Fe2+/Mn2+ transporter